MHYVCMQLNQQLRAERDERDELHSELHKSQQEKGSIEKVTNMKPLYEQV